MNPYDALRKRRIPPSVWTVLLLVVLAIVALYAGRRAVYIIGFLVLVAVVVIVMEYSRRRAEERSRPQALRIAISGDNDLRGGLGWHGYDLDRLPLRLGATIGPDGLELWKGSRERPLATVPLDRIVGVAPGFGTIRGYAAPQIVVVTCPTAEQVAAYNDDAPDDPDDPDDETPESDFGPGTIALPLPLWDAFTLFPAGNARAWRLLQQVGQRVPILPAASVVPDHKG